MGQILCRVSFLRATQIVSTSGKENESAENEESTTSIAIPREPQMRMSSPFNIGRTFAKVELR